MSNFPKKLRVCSFESRRGDEMRSLIERHGASATIVPSMREVPLEDNSEAFQFLEALANGGLDAVIFQTGIGAETLLKIVETKLSRDQFFGQLQECEAIVVRGPKPAAVLKSWDVRIDHRVPEPNTWRELLALCDAEYSVAGKTIALQEYGEPSTNLIEGLQARGAAVLPVPVYRWEFPVDVEPLRQSIRATIAGEFDVLMFTSANQLSNVLRAAGEQGLKAEWIAAANRCRIASIGPTASEKLKSCGLRVDVEASPPRMGQLVKAAVQELKGERVEE